MTHRSRTGGGTAPQKHKTGKRKQHQRKLHHPPPRNQRTDDHADEETSIPASAFLESPTDDEILELVHHALRDTLDSPTFSSGVQKVKGLLYDKKWLELFGDSTLLESYAGRWVPSRACCYRELFAMLGDVRKLFVVARGDSGEDSESEASESENEDEGDAPSTAGPSTSPSPAEPLLTRIISLGGGASSELLAVAAMAHSCRNLEPKLTSSDPKGKSPVRWSWTGVDIGAWHKIVDKFKQSLQAEWEMDSDTLDIDFIQADLLKPSAPISKPVQESSDAAPPAGIDLPTILSTPPALLTLLFTLTELLTQSRPLTFSLLRSITSNTPPGTLLLVADSASDLSEFEMGSSGRKWPIHMILDTMLVGPPGAASGEWEVVRKEDSRWFRMGEGAGAGWPVKLENTRYWFRLYRRL